MKSATASLFLILILSAVGGLMWLAGRNEQRLAAAEYSLVTLRYETAAAELDAAAGSPLLEPLMRLVGVDLNDQGPNARYWQGDYESLSQSEDPSLKLLAANAEYRALRASGGPYQIAVSRLDTIAKRYADVLRLEPGNADAAYNYEFIVRLRAALVAAKKPLPAAPDPGITVHGSPGAPPAESDAKKFKMIVPMLPDERQEAEEAGRAGRKIRKG
jgi:hypothetical protein